MHQYSSMSSPVSRDVFSVPKKNLQRLVIIRWLMLAGLILGITVGNHYFFVDFPIKTILILLSIMAILTGWTSFRLRYSSPLTELEFTAQILADILGITCIFYFIGGASNPFVSYYLVPLAIAAATLPWKFVTLLSLASFASYSSLLFFYQPIVMLEPELHTHGAADLSINVHPHTIGMWFNFLLSASLICFFVVRMATALKERELELSFNREETLRDEQVLAVATLAAGTAHELGTPLTTMKVLVAELLEENSEKSELNEDLANINNQLTYCREILRKLVDQSESVKRAGDKKELIEDYCSRVFDQWRLIRPDVHAEIKIKRTKLSVAASLHPTIDQAILNILNNAADASPASVAVQAAWDAKELIVTIDDEGDGIDESLISQLGQKILTTTGRGMGLGLFLSNATINRYGGSLKFDRRIEGGTRTEIIVPLHAGAPGDE